MENYRDFIHALHKQEMIKFGDFELHSGKRSPIYVDLRTLSWFPSTLRICCRFMADKLWESGVDGDLVGVPYAGIPIAVECGQMTGRRVGWIRKELHASGTRRLVEGRDFLNPVLIDDLITDGKSKLETVEASGLPVRHVFVVIDRQQGGGDALRKAGIQLHSLFTLAQALDVLAALGCITEVRHRAVFDYLRSIQ